MKTKPVETQNLVSKKSTIVKTKKKATKPITKSSKQASPTVSPLDQLIALKKQADEIKDKMDTLKEQLKEEILQTQNKTYTSQIGTVTIKVSNEWSLPPVNEAKAREILKDSFTFYFKEKLSFGVEPLAKKEINTLTELGQQLSELVEIKETQSWEIRPQQ